MQRMRRKASFMQGFPNLISESKLLATFGRIISFLVPWKDGNPDLES